MVANWLDNLTKFLDLKLRGALQTHFWLKLGYCPNSPPNGKKGFFCIISNFKHNILSWKSWGIDDLWLVLKSWAWVNPLPSSLGQNPNLNRKWFWRAPQYLALLSFASLLVHWKLMPQGACALWTFDINRESPNSNTSQESLLSEIQMSKRPS